MLPYSMPAEQAIIATFLMHSEVAQEYLSDLQPDFFFTPHYKIIITCMRELALEFKPTESVLIYEQLKRIGQDGRIDRNGGLSEFIGKDVHSSLLSDFFTEVKGFWKVRTVIETCQEIIKKGQKTNIADINDFMEYFNQTSNKIMNQISPDVVESAATVCRRVVLEIEEKSNKGITHSGIPSGLLDIDQMLGGFQDSHLIILAGRPAMGKTALALQLLRHAASIPNKSALFFSLEMTNNELMKRLLAIEGKVYGNHISRYNLTAEDYHKLYPAAASISSSNMFFIEQGGLTITDIIIQSRKMKKTQGNLGFIVIDYLQLIKGEGKKTDNREQEVSQISTSLKALAKELKCPIIALCQLSRKPEGREDKRPLPSDLRESGSLEQDADVVLMIYRDEFYKKESDEKGIAEVIVAKNRHGETGTAKLAFIKEYPAFFNLALDIQR